MSTYCIPFDSGALLSKSQPGKILSDTNEMTNVRELCTGILDADFIMLLGEISTVSWLYDNLLDTHHGRRATIVFYVALEALWDWCFERYKESLLSLVSFGNMAEQRTAYSVNELMISFRRLNGCVTESVGIRALTILNTQTWKAGTLRGLDHRRLLRPERCVCR